MNTYKLSANSKSKLLDLQHHAAAFVLKRYRCVVSTSRKLTTRELEGITVHAHARRDSFEEFEPWAMSNILEELNVENEKNFPVPLSRQKKAVERWEGINATVEELKTYLQREKFKLEKASRNVMLTHGKRNVYMGGELYDPSYTLELVWYKKRMGG